tara:strand:+ start:444 stop:2390 length:1947 start_codon:yes stop_codon:yes gene_type:complete
MSVEEPWLDFVKEIPEKNIDEPWKNFTSIPKEETVEKQKVRANLQGWTLGFADEIEAMVRSSLSSKSYEEIRDDIRVKLDKYRAAHPKEALGMELLGAIVPTAVAYLTPWPGDEVAATSSLLGTIARAGKVGALEGGTAAYATGEEGAIADLTRVPAGAVVGAAFTGLITLAAKPVGYFANKLMTKAREVGGDEGAGVVAEKLRELAKTTGRSEDDLLKAIANGEILVDDPALQNILTALNNDLQVTTKIDDVLVNRAGAKADDTAEAMQETLTPGVEGNVLKDYLKKNNDKKNVVKDLYAEVYQDTQRLSKEIVDSLESAIASEPSLTAALDDIYRLKKMKPLTRIVKSGKNKGKVVFNRDATLEDAEIIRRAIAEAKDEAFTAKKGIKGALLDDLEKELRKHLDEFSDPLKLAREEAKILFDSNDAFELGRKVFKGGGDVDELVIKIQDMMSSGIERGNAEALQGLRTGVMVALRDKLRKQPTFFNKASKEGGQYNEILRRVFPNENIEDIINRVRLAATTKNTKDKVLGGSQTSGRETAKLDAVTLASAATGNASAIANIGLKIIGDLDPKLTAKQKNKLVNLLMSDDPDLIRKALLDPSWMAKLQGYINRFGSGMLDTVILTGNIEGGNIAGNEGNKMLNSLMR